MIHPRLVLLPLCVLVLLSIIYSFGGETIAEVKFALKPHVNVGQEFVEQSASLKNSKVTESFGYTYFNEEPPLVIIQGQNLQLQKKKKKHSSTSLKKHSDGFSGKIKNLYDLSKSYMATAPSSYADSIHPITTLIQEAALKWENLLDRQSKTLLEAVEEYQRRYDRPPPLGFDKWFKFAVENDVVLLDEYDQINIDIEPFLSVPFKVLSQRAQQMSENPQANHFSLHIEDGIATKVGPESNSYRANDALRLLETFSKNLPDMHINYSNDDGPGFLMTGAAREEYLKLARAGKELEGSAVNSTFDDAGYLPWIKSCSGDSVARRAANGQRLLTPPASDPSFINHDHLSAMDTCSHPENLGIHGMTNAWPGPGPAYLVPIFAWSKTQMHLDILSTPMDQFYTPTEEYFDWEYKQAKILWRGGNTGIWAFRHNLWRSTQRPRLMTLVNEKIGSISVRFALTYHGARDIFKKFVGSLAELNSYYFDVSYTGIPLQCHDDGSCDDYLKLFPFVVPMGVKEQNGYKYILDVDGNAWSGRFHRLMGSKSAIMKATIFPEWYSSRIMPWYHYIPVKIDYSDLHDVAAYFIGTPDGNNSHDKVGEMIGLQGKEWTENHWREVDLAAYQFRLYLEYARALYGVHGSHDLTI